MIIFITGGARSGKSKYAQELALSLSDSPVYVATAKVWDMNQKASGSVNNLFQNFNNDINKRIVETAAKESESHVSISQKNVEALWQYASGIKCQ